MKNVEPSCVGCILGVIAVLFAAIFRRRVV